MLRRALTGDQTRNRVRPQAFYAESERVPRQPAEKREQPRNELPAFGPRFAVRITISEPHCGQAGAASLTPDIGGAVILREFWTPPINFKRES